MLIKSKYWWFNIAFICGGGLELASYIVRILAVTAPQVSTYYLLQIVALIIGPAFFTGGIYFLFAQFVVAHGRKYSMLKPMWYSYLFISFDFTSLVIQAIGGAMASLATQQNKSSKPGTYLMLAGIAFQAVSMSVFFFFWIESLTRVFFKDKILDINGEIHPLSKRSFLNFFKLLFNIGEAKQYKMNELEKFYNPKFAEVRSRKLFTWFPLVITSSTVLILIRCIYRVVELAQGFRGWLITREWPLMVFDATMIGLVALLFIPFHPVFVLGSKNIVKLSLIKNNLDEITEEENTEEESSEEEKLYQ